MQENKTFWHVQIAFKLSFEYTSDVHELGHLWHLAKYNISESFIFNRF